jgi:hypothetical protein
MKQWTQAIIVTLVAMFSSDSSLCRGLADWSSDHTGRLLEIPKVPSSAAGTGDHNIYGKEIHSSCSVAPAILFSKKYT